MERRGSWPRLKNAPRMYIYFFCWFIVGSGAVPLISDLGEFLSCVSRKAKVAQKEKNI